MSAMEFAKAMRLGLLGRTCSGQVLCGDFECVLFLSGLFFKTTSCIAEQSRMKHNDPSGISTGLRAGMNAGGGDMRTESLVHSYILGACWIQSVYLAFLPLSFALHPCT